MVHHQQKIEMVQSYNGRRERETMKKARRTAQIRGEEDGSRECPLGGAPRSLQAAQTQDGQSCTCAMVFEGSGSLQFLGDNKLNERIKRP